MANAILEKLEIGDLYSEHLYQKIRRVRSRKRKFGLNGAPNFRRRHYPNMDNSRRSGMINGIESRVEVGIQVKWDYNEETGFEGLRNEITTVDTFDFKLRTRDKRPPKYWGEKRPRTSSKTIIGTPKQFSVALRNVYNGLRNPGDYATLDNLQRRKLELARRVYKAGINTFSLTDISRADLGKLIEYGEEMNSQLRRSRIRNPFCIAFRNIYDGLDNPNEYVPRTSHEEEKLKFAKKVHEIGAYEFNYEQILKARDGKLAEYQKKIEGHSGRKIKIENKEPKQFSAALKTVYHGERSPGEYVTSDSLKKKKLEFARMVHKAGIRSISIRDILRASFNQLRKYEKELDDLAEPEGNSMDHEQFSVALRAVYYGSRKLEDYRTSDELQREKLELARRVCANGLSSFSIGKIATASLDEVRRYTEQVNVLSTRF